jgi:glycosyltransferase involved in cell wall biosynthesis
MPKCNIYYFFPLASIGGTESVHADILEALKDYPSETYIRYRTNVWKGREYAQSKAAFKEGVAMLPNFKMHSKVTFVSSWLESPRFGRMMRYFFIKKLIRKINKQNTIIIFWHRDSIAFLWPHIKNHVPIIDIVHNNSNNNFPDAQYLLNDWAPRINRRVLVNEGLKKWILPLYAAANYPDELANRISTINHTVTIPDELPNKSTSVFHVLYVGREAKEKRIALFFEIAERFSQDPRIRFRAVGIDQPINAPQNVQCLGVITNKETLEQCYASSHVLVLTSESEGFPKVISEAMAFGCVPVVTAVGAIPEALNHGEQAILTDPFNCVDETVNFLSSFLVDRTEYETLSKKAYLYAKEEFDANRFNNEWRTLIQTLS